METELDGRSSSLTKQFLVQQYIFNFFFVKYILLVVNVDRVELEKGCHLIEGLTKNDCTV
jgi:hypothetical protein